MFYTGSTVEYRERTPSSLVSVRAEREVQARKAEEHQQKRAAEHAVDTALADSFPASDPPPWTLGITPPQPWRRATDKPADSAVGGGVAGNVVNVTRPAGVRRFVDGLMSLAGAVGVALLVPFVILVVGLPIALIVRGTIEAVSWLVALLFG